MKKYKFLLLDADNTLFDFDKCEAHAFKKAFEDNGESYTDEVYSLYHVINDNIWKELEKGLITRDELKVERYRRLYEALNIEGDGYKTLSSIYEKRLSEQYFELEGSFEMLSALYDDYELYVVTNGITRVQESRFASSRITQLLKKIYISEKMGVSKPNPAFFDMVISDIGEIDRSKYLVIGDSLSSDMDGAIASGIDSCWYNPSQADSKGRNVTYNVKSFDEILNILK